MFKRYIWWWSPLLFILIAGVFYSGIISAPKREIASMKPGSEPIRCFIVDNVNVKKIIELDINWTGNKARATVPSHLLPIAAGKSFYAEIKENVLLGLITTFDIY